MSQSTRGHRLSQKAYQIGGEKLQLPLLCALFKAHLEDGRDIADLDVLSDLAEGVGMMTKEEVNTDFVEAHHDTDTSGSRP